MEAVEPTPNETINAAKIGAKTPPLKLLTSYNVCKLKAKADEEEVSPMVVTHLFLPSNRGFEALTDIFQKFRQLTVLEVRDNDLTSIAGFTLPKVTRVHFDNNKLTNLAWLGCFPNLKMLFANNNRIECSSMPFASHDKLETLHIAHQRPAEGHPVFAMDSFVGLSTLKELDISDNGLTDISFLNALTRIDLLRLNDNPLPDVSVLALGMDIPQTPSLSVSTLVMTGCPCSKSPQLPQTAVFNLDVTDLNGSTLTPFQLKFLRAKQARVHGLIPKSEPKTDPELERRRAELDRDRRLRLGGWTNGGAAIPYPVRK